MAMVQTSKQGPLHFSLASGMRTKVSISHSALESSHRLLAGQMLRCPSGPRNIRTHGDSAGFESTPYLTVICGQSSHGAVRLRHDLVIAGSLKVRLVCLELSKHLKHCGRGWGGQSERSAVARLASLLRADSLFTLSLAYACTSLHLQIQRLLLQPSSQQPLWLLSCA